MYKNLVFVPWYYQKVWPPIDDFNFGVSKSVLININRNKCQMSWKQISRTYFLQAFCGWCPWWDLSRRSMGIPRQTLTPVNAIGASLEYTSCFHQTLERESKRGRHYSLKCILLMYAFPLGSNFSSTSMVVLALLKEHIPSSCLQNLQPAPAQDSGLLRDRFLSVLNCSFRLKKMIQMNQNTWEMWINYIFVVQ